MKKTCLIVALVIATVLFSGTCFARELTVADFIGTFDTDTYPGEGKVVEKVGNSMTRVVPWTKLVKFEDLENFMGDINIEVMNSKNTLQKAALQFGYNAVVGLKVNVVHNFQSFNGQIINGYAGFLTATITCSGTPVYLK